MFCSLCCLIRSVVPQLKLFDVLQHFPHPLDSRFHFHNAQRNRDIIGLGARRIDLSEHFLTDKLQLAALRRAAIQQSEKLLGMTSESSDLFIDVTAISEKRDFADDIIFTDRLKHRRSNDGHVPESCRGTRDNLWRQKCDTASLRFNDFALLLQDPDAWIRLRGWRKSSK
jgi:hypothetical protein